MAVEISIIQNICDEVTHEVESVYEGLSLHFIVHNTGKLREAAALAEHNILDHRASRAGRAIIQKAAIGERSNFLGMAIATEKMMMGLKKKDHLLALFNINADHFKDEAEISAQIYHLIWHAIDLYEIRKNPSYSRKFKDGPLIPKRSALNLSKAHLQADVFSGVLSVLKNDDPAINETLVKRISQKRGIMSLRPLSNYKAEDFPSVIAMDSCELALKEILESPTTKEEHLQIARQISLDVGHAYSENSIRQWWDYCIPAQDMAWRGYTPEEILGAASNTSENPFVRSVAYLIHEVTGVEPVSAESLHHKYNAFIDPSMNANLHREMIDTIFEEAVTDGDGETGGEALINAANKQNKDLTEGRIIGWCAKALQDAAKAFEAALKTGASPIQAARMQFEGNRNVPQWEDLKDLGNKIVDQRKQGFAVTMGHIAEICHNNAAFAPVLDSMKITMNDPSYVQQLEAANDLALAPNTPTVAPTQDFAPKAPEPAASGPKGPAPTGPAPSAAPQMPSPAPGLGGGGSNRSAQMMYHRKIMAQKAKDDAHTEDTKADQ